jgi:hypothetical protein
VVSKFNRTVAAAVAVAMLWIEHGHRVSIISPARVEAAAATACPDDDSVPFSADCIAFIHGASLAARSKVNLGETASAAPPDTQGRADPQGPACPASNESAPYSARCLKFLSGWFWQPDGKPAP